jgi:hypothetical protein
MQVLTQGFFSQFLCSFEHGYFTMVKVLYPSCLESDDLLITSCVSLGIGDVSLCISLDNTTYTEY